MIFIAEEDVFFTNSIVEQKPTYIPFNNSLLPGNRDYRTIEIGGFMSLWLYINL